MQNKWSWGLLLTLLVVQFFGLIVWLFAEETCCCVQSCTFACGPDIPFTSWSWDCTSFKRLFTPSFQNHLVLMIRNLLSRVIHGYLVHFSLFHIFHISLCNSFPSRIAASLLWMKSKKILQNKFCSSWASSVPVRIALVCTCLFLNYFFLEKKWQNFHNIRDKVFCTKCW